jgi:hypothetical protein
MDKLIELSSDGDFRVFECGKWRAVLTDYDKYMHMCVTSFISKDKITRPTIDQVKLAADLLFRRDNKKLDYIRGTPFGDDESVVHLWEDNTHIRRILLDLLTSKNNI